VPDPLVRTSAVAGAYHRTLSQCDNMDPPSASGLEGYISARVLAEGLRRPGGSATREGLIAALESIRKLDLGGFEVNYSPTGHSGSRYVEFLIIARGGRLKK